MEPIKVVGLILLFVGVAHFSKACNDKLKNDAIRELKELLKRIKLKQILIQCCVRGVKDKASNTEPEIVKTFPACLDESFKAGDYYGFAEKLGRANFTVNDEGVNKACLGEIPEKLGLLNKEHECKSFVDGTKNCLTILCSRYKEVNKDNECTMKLLNVGCEYAENEM